MSKLPVVSGRELIRVLAQFGFVVDRQKSSHLILVRPDPPTTITVPDHRERDRGTLRAILRQTGISVEQFRALL